MDKLPKTSAETTSFHTGKKYDISGKLCGQIPWNMGFFFLIPYNVFLSEKNSLSQQMTIHLWFSSVLGYTLQFDIDHISFAQGYLKKFCINDLNHLQRLKIKHAAINVHYIHKTTRQSQLCVTKKRRKCSLPSVFIHYSYLYQWRLY